MKKSHQHDINVILKWYDLGAVYQAQLLSGLYLVSSIASKEILKEQNIKHIIVYLEWN